MDINPTTKSIGELALEVPNAIGVLERWQIDYCCKGGRSIQEACADAGVNVDELMLEIGKGRPAEARQWQNESLKSLQAYIVGTHHVFTREIMETIVQLADKVAMRHGPRHAEVIELAKVAHAMYGDLMPHMLKEEQVLFPYIVQMETAVMNGEPAPTPFFGTVKNPIRMMMNEHDAVGDMLREARVITKDYSLPEDACLSFRALYERMLDVEKDLHEHIHLENNVLFPRAASMEEGVRPEPAFGGNDHGKCGCGCSH